jgi:hypothetical protein
LLYDTEKDRWQVNNVAGEPEYRPVLERLRGALRDWQTETRDVGMIHEWQAAALCKDSGTPMVEAARDESRFALDRVLDTAWRVGMPDQVSEFERRLADPDPTVRYWAAIGLRAAGGDAVAAKESLRKALADESIPVRVEAAGILVARHSDRAALDQLAAMLTIDDEHAVLHAARTIQMLGEKARPVLPALQAALPKVKGLYARWSIQGAISGLTGRENPVFQAKPSAARPARAKAKQSATTS